MADTTVIEYIQKAKTLGTAKEAIYRELLDKGFSIDDIQKGYLSLSVEEEKVDTSKKTIRIIIAIATLLIGAGIFSFIAANWKVMPSTVKVIVILTSMLTSYGAGWYFKEKKNLVRTGNGLIILGAVIYGAGIFLIAQIFHIRANWPDGLILWMLGSIAMAYAVDVFALFVLAIPLGLVALVGYPIGMVQSLGTTPFQLTSTLLLLIGTIVMFDAGLRIRKRLPPELRELY